MLDFGIIIKKKTCSEEIVLKRKTIVVMLMLTLLISTLMGFLFVKPATANPEGSIPNLSMPIEYVNYTITSINGTLWAKIDGDYPIYLLKQTDCSFSGDLPMVYPMPPQTTNISISLDNKEISWSNYTQSYPGELHHTAIGDWWMIYCNLENVSDYFELKIHYEHPIELINGSYLFLYDLNISPYLSSQSNNSTAYFTIQMKANFTSLNVYSTETDAKWNPVNFTLAENGSTEVVSVVMYSEYGNPLLGDLVVEFSQHRQVSEFPLWTLTTISIGVLLGALFYKRKTAK
jgi:hypothetical protein